jgi:hypothetical protein
MRSSPCWSLRPWLLPATLLRAGGFVTCTVSDNGSAPVRFQPKRGLRIVEELTKALDGNFELTFGSGGTISILSFPYDEPRSSEDEAPEIEAEPPRNS